jgi:hypothetical protein
LKPYSRPVALASIDGRSRESVMLRKLRADLVAHVGGNPSATQRAVIERACMLSLHLHLLDEKILKEGMSEHDSRSYLAWSNALARTMTRLGMKGTAEKPPSLSDYIAKDGAE